MRSYHGGSGKARACPASLTTGRPVGRAAFFERLCGPTTIATGRFNLSHWDFNALRHRSNPSASRFAVDPVFFDRVLEYASGFSNSGGSTISWHCDDRHRNSLLTGNGGFEICALLRGEIGHLQYYGATPSDIRNTARDHPPHPRGNLWRAESLVMMSVPGTKLTIVDVR
jgi:hypothetical protein